MLGIGIAACTFDSGGEVAEIDPPPLAQSIFLTSGDALHVFDVDTLEVVTIGDFDYGDGGSGPDIDDLALSSTGKLVGLRIVPMQIRQFRLERASDKDAVWVQSKLNEEGGRFGSRLHLEADVTLSLE